MALDWDTFTEAEWDTFSEAEWAAFLVEAAPEIIVSLLLEHNYTTFQILTLLI